jgi:hypothetical protein
MFALVLESDGTADETSAVQSVAAAGEIGSSLGEFACTVGVAAGLNWTLLTRSLAGTVCSLTEPASLALKNGLVQMKRY